MTTTAHLEIESVPEDLILEEEQILDSEKPKPKRTRVRNKSEPKLQTSARNGLTSDKAFQKLVTDFSFLESKEFKSIFDNYYKNGDKVYISLKTGSKIEINKDKISKEANSDIEKSSEANISLEVKAMLALCVERKMVRISIDGDKEHMKAALSQINEMNSLLPDDKKISIYPKDREQKALFKTLMTEVVSEQVKNEFNIELAKPGITKPGKLKM